MFTVLNDSSNSQQYYPVGKITPSYGWFVPDNDTNQYECELTSIYIPYNLNNTGGTIWIGGTPVEAAEYQYMRVVANDSLQPNEFPEEVQEIAEDELYERLLVHPELLADPELNSFYLLESQSASGQLTKLRNMQQSFDPEIVQARNNLSSAEFYLLQVALALEQNAAAIEAATGGTETLESEREILLNEYDVLYALYEEKLATYSGLYSVYLEQILEENAQVEVSTLIQENEQIVNTIALETVLEGNFEFNSAQKDLLESVIYQCPKAGGKPVYRARAMYALINDTIEYEDGANCASQGFYRIRKEEESQKTVETFNYIVKPNPAKDYILISSIPENSSIDIYNVQGRIVYSATTSSSDMKVNTERLRTGIYYLKIYNSDGIRTSKVSILH